MLTIDFQDNIGGEAKIKWPGVKYLVMMYFYSCLIIVQLKIRTVKGRKNTSPKISFIEIQGVVHCAFIAFVIMEH